MDNPYIGIAANQYANQEYLEKGITNEMRKEGATDYVDFYVKTHQQTKAKAKEEV